MIVFTQIKITSDFILNPGLTEIAQKIIDTVNAVKWDHHETGSFGAVSAIDTRL